MKDLKLKVCGMREPENIRELVRLCPDFIGFIFYSKSSRCVSDLDEEILLTIPTTTKKVGVFVNESVEKVLEFVSKYRLDFVQLHGDESLEFAASLKERGIGVIKVFRVSDQLPQHIGKYQGIADYVLFDTATSTYGGSGRQFDWNILSNYTSNIPFLLSGGLEAKDMERVKELNLPMLAGLDVNSRVEIAPAVKDLKKVEELIEQL